MTYFDRVDINYCYILPRYEWESIVLKAGVSTSMSNPTPKFVVGAEVDLTPRPMFNRGRSVEARFSKDQGVGMVFEAGKRGEEFVVRVGASAESASYYNVDFDFRHGPQCDVGFTSLQGGQPYLKYTTQQSLGLRSSGNGGIVVKESVSLFPDMVKDMLKTESASVDDLPPAPVRNEGRTSDTVNSVSVEVLPPAPVRNGGRTSDTVYSAERLISVPIATPTYYSPTSGSTEAAVILFSFCGLVLVAKSFFFWLQKKKVERQQKRAS
jgi:hypothetical protein